MKKLTQITSLLVACCLLPAACCFAQTPQAINYQAVARNAAGNILGNQNICVQSTITDGNGGPVLYQETFNVTTNQFGLFTLRIGNGVVVTGTFSAINWNAVTAWQSIELKIGCTGAYVLMGSAQLLSVPYALSSATSADNKWTQNVNDISNSNSGNVGIGTATPISKLDVKAGNVAVNDSSIRLRAGNDPYHFLKFDGATNGPRLAGWSGGVLSSSANDTIKDVLRWTDAGNVGIGTNSPQAKLDVNGSVRINDGMQGAGKVLTSDGFGTGSWQALPAQQVAFKVGLVFSSAVFDNSGFNRIIFDTVQINYGNGYDQATGLFTAPSSGLYYFYTQMGWYSTFTNGAEVTIRIANNPIPQSKRAIKDSIVSPESMNVSAVYFLNAGEQVEFGAAEGGTGSQTIVGFSFYTFAYGYKIF